MGEQLDEEELARKMKTGFTKTANNPSNAGNELSQSLVGLVGTILPLVVIPLVKTIVNKAKEPSAPKEIAALQDETDIVRQAKGILGVEQTELLATITRLNTYKQIVEEVKKKKVAR